MTSNTSTTGYDSPVYTDESDGGTSTKDVAKDEARGVAGSAVGAGQQVAGTAKAEASNVAAEAAGQAKDVLGQARNELRQQAADQQQRVAGGLRSLGSELGSMADRSEQSGVATDLARQASSVVNDVAGWLDQRDPAGLLDEVKTFARRRPGTFLAIALGAGLAAGRLTRGLKDEATASTGGSGSTGQTGSPTPSQSTTGGYAGAGTTGGTTAGFQETAPGFSSPAVAEPAVVVEPATAYETVTPAGAPGTPGYTDTRYSGQTDEVIESPPTGNSPYLADDPTVADPAVRPAGPVYRDEENR